MSLAKFTARDLKDRHAQIFLNYQIFDMVSVLSRPVRLVNSQLAFERAHYYLVFVSSLIVVYISDADGVVVELFTVANGG